ncbi:MAG: polysaccharide export protein [Candidatus Hydrogenedentes bacterium]|nr:polysaccharide export protein [Candidatus Hydrogenedentota bacterium]
MERHVFRAMRVLAWTGAVCALGMGCASRPAVVESMRVPTDQLREAAAEEAPAEAAAGAEEEVPYVIGAGDVLEFRSFDDETLSQEVVVRYDGHVSLPLIADLKVAGATRDEAQASLEEAYLAVFKEPQVSLTVKAPQSKSFYVMGDVMRPNEYPYVRAITVLQAVNLAGGLRYSSRTDEDYVSQQGTLTKAFIIRGRGAAREVIECDMRQLTHPGAHPADTLVKPNDFIYVPEGVNLVYVLGEVQRPSVFQLAEGQTLVQLLARAGSFSGSTARIRHVVLLRETDAENTLVTTVNVRRMLKTGEHITLRPGDVIYIPRARLVRLQEFINRITGSITPVLDLYNLAWETGYTKKRLELLYDESYTSDEGNLTSLLQNIRSYGELIEGYQSSLPETP